MKSLKTTITNDFGAKEINIYISDMLLLQRRSSCFLKSWTRQCWTQVAYYQQQDQDVLMARIKERKRQEMLKKAKDGIGPKEPGRFSSPTSLFKLPTTTEYRKLDGLPPIEKSPHINLVYRSEMASYFHLCQFSISTFTVVYPLTTWQVVSSNFSTVPAPGVRFSKPLSF